MTLNWSEHDQSPVGWVRSGLGRVQVGLPNQSHTSLNLTSQEGFDQDGQGTSDFLTGHNMTNPLQVGLGQGRSGQVRLPNWSYIGLNQVGFGQVTLDYLTGQ